jgi:protein-S-isoprenylcysteine O-methyltransferase Ste14
MVFTAQAGGSRATKSFAFGYGALPMMLLLPPFVSWLWWCMVVRRGVPALPDGEFIRSIRAPSVTSVAIFGGWFSFQALLQIYAPGRWVEGIPMHDGTRLKYKLNGSRSWWFTWAVLVVLVLSGVVDPSKLYGQIPALMSTVNIFAFGLSIYLYIWGRRHPDEGSEQLRGNVVQSFFMGTSRNPRNGLFDWKLFCEARPGLIAWVVIDISLAFAQLRLYGTVSTPMILVCFFHFWYVADCYLHEEAILTTWDIRHENFGFMLAWGDLVWVPFTYTLQALFLASRRPFALPLWAYAGIVLLHFAGFALFRGANIQKHGFRKDPRAPLRWSGGRPEFIATGAGSALLVNGFWGRARHLNYLGDLMMGLSWCLVTGLHSVLAYFYIIYFTLLLLHRERRDHVACAAKYGRDWDEYCARVRWRILPGVY